MLKFFGVATIIVSAVVMAILYNNNFAYKHHGDVTFVYDTTSVNDAKVERIHQFLVENNLYDGKSGELFLLKQSGKGEWVLKFPIYQGVEISPQVMNEVETFANSLKMHIFEGAPIEVHITNSGYQGVQFFKI